jgi:hypothetical protein
MAVSSRRLRRRALRLRPVKWNGVGEMDRSGLGGVVSRSGISSSEMFSVSGMYTTGSVPGGGAPAGLVRAVKPGRCPTSAPPSRVEGGAVGDEADGEVLLMNSACK